MDARDFLESAQKLLKGNQEVDYRNAASRAYYCAYHVCKTHLETLPASQKTIGASHERVINDFLAHPDKKLKKIGRKLNQIKALRRKADYTLNVPFSHTNAKQVLRHVYEILSEFEVSTEA